MTEKDQEIARLREYLNAAANDYEGVIKILAESDVSEYLTKSIQEMRDSGSLLRRAANGEDVWSEYESELVKAKKAHEEARTVCGIMLQVLETIQPYVGEMTPQDTARLEKLDAEMAEMLAK